MRSSVEAIKLILLRDLTNLEGEIKAYHNQAELWSLKGDIKNTAGNLTLHICGNLQHFIGSVIGEDGYLRQREDEFGKKNLSAEELLSEIKSTKQSVEKAMDRISDDQLEEYYPIEVFGKPMTFSYFLIHLTGHLMYHLGQINYHRRLLAS